MQQKNDNTAESLQQMMFDQLRRLQDPTLDLDKEVKRSTAITNAANVIVNVEKTKLDMAKFQFAADNKTGNKQKRIGHGNKN